MTTSTVLVRTAFIASLFGAACSSSSSGASSAGTDAGGGGDAAVSADAGAAYPAGPYGIAVGDVFPNVTWQGERKGVAPVVSIASADYYDPDGSKGIRGVMFTINAVACGGPMGPCNTEGKATEAAVSGPPYDFANRGGRAVDVIVQNWTMPGSGGPAASTVADIDTWGKAVGATYDVVIDPAMNPMMDGGLPSTSIGTFMGVPTEIVVDPRTMKVTAVALGEGPNAEQFKDLDAVMVKNGAAEVAIPDAGAD